jgi:CheY-like chemotaxis protein
MYGPTFVDRMKCRPGFQDTPVIFVTGVQRSTLGGIADPVLIKPFDPEVLVGLVSQHCVPIETSTGHLD